MGITWGLKCGFLGFGARIVESQVQQKMDTEMKAGMV